MVKIDPPVKKFDKKIPILIILFCVIVFTISITFVIDLSETPDLSETSSKMDKLIDTLSSTHLIPVPMDVEYFQGYITLFDGERHQNEGLPIIQGLRTEIKNDYLDELVSSFKRDDRSVVIYPIFTSAAYNEPGFYTYYRGECDITCITDVSYRSPTFGFASSGATAQILYHVGYDFLTDDEVDKNPDLLENYDTVILLHNEYVTKKAFDAISTHPNIIFLFPNALYAEVDVNH